MAHEVLGIGGPFVDHVIQVPEAFLDSIGGAKGGMVAVDFETLQAILDASEAPKTRSPGGSTANTLRGLAHLGHRCAMTGKIGTDAHGAFFLDSLARLGIGTHFAQSATPTAQVACLITPDGERTMRTFLGSVPEMTGADVAQGLFEGTRLALIEGYTLPNDRLTHQSMLYARDAGTKIAFSLASFEIVEAFKDVIHSLIEEHVSIVFANEAEAHALHGLSPRYCCQELSRHCEIAVVSEGAQGCYVAWEGQVAHCPALPVKAVDCTGAGDLFAAGFLHGWLQGLDPETCGRIGCILGAAIVQVPGAILPEEQWPRIREELGVVGLMGH